MELVIVESPSKAKTISKFLGKNYQVISSLGHVMDLPKTKLGIDLNNNYQPLYQIIKGKEDIVNEIQKLSKKADLVILATDPDREGEAISWHIYNLISNLNKNIKRIVFHEITDDAIFEALKSPRDIDINLVDAQQARRVLDRLVGYSLSPLLWQKIRYGLSAGRVQSVALKLIVDREREIRNFVSKEFWKIFISVSENENQDNVTINFVNKINSNDAIDNTQHKDNKKLLFELITINSKKVNLNTKQECIAIIDNFKKQSLLVKSVNVKDLISKALPPFITSTYQQACINTFNISAKKAMSIAQKLYENGLITYMRTDSFNLSEKAIRSARKFIEVNFGKDYLPKNSNVFKNKSRNAQEAHEAIRPTDFKILELGSNFTEQENQVYKLIFSRAIASQMKPAKFKSYTVKLETKINEDILGFKSSFKILEFDGWLKLFPKSKFAMNTSLEFVDTWKKFYEGETLYIKDIIAKQHFTEPPSRYTEATLIKALDKFGIGRPSTYATILSIILQRDYITKISNTLVPTEIGEIVINLLEENFQEIVNIDFTAQMEDDLDKIALGKLGFKSFIHNFYVDFEQKVKQKEKEIDRQKYTVLGVTDEICDICGAKMAKKIGRFGIFLSCVNYPNCKGMKSLKKENIEDLDLNNYEQAPITNDGRDFILKKGRYGYFWAHPDYPKVKEVYPLKLKEDKVKEIFGEPPKASDGSVMILKKGRYGYFWAHPDYPKVKELKKISKKIM